VHPRRGHLRHPRGCVLLRPAAARRGKGRTPSRGHGRGMQSTHETEGKPGYGCARSASAARSSSDVTWAKASRDWRRISARERTRLRGRRAPSRAAARRSRSDARLASSQRCTPAGSRRSSEGGSRAGEATPRRQPRQGEEGRGCCARAWLRRRAGCAMSWSSCTPFSRCAGQEPRLVGTVRGSDCELDPKRPGSMVMVERRGRGASEKRAGERGPTTRPGQRSKGYRTGSASDRMPGGTHVGRPWHASAPLDAILLGTRSAPADTIVLGTPAPRLHREGAGHPLAGARGAVGEVHAATR
jgi:hypothetical protein